MVKEVNQKHIWSQYIAELIGTFFLVFFGCGAVILHQLQPGAMESFAIPIVFGGIVATMIYATGHISGAHFNPAVTLAFFAAKKFPAYRVPGYVMSQILGAVLASFFHLLIWGPAHSFGTTGLSVSLGVGLGLEVILSFALMFVIMAVATDSRAVGEAAGIAIGTTVTLCAFIGGPLTGASMNPARSLGPALLSGSFDQLWVYLVFPVVGTVLAALVYDRIRCYSEEHGDFGCC